MLARGNICTYQLYHCGPIPYTSSSQFSGMKKIGVSSLGVFQVPAGNHERIGKNQGACRVERTTGGQT